MLMNIVQLKSYKLILFIAVLFSTSISKPLISNSQIVKDGDKCISSIFNGNYSGAYRRADAMINSNTNSPAGYFFKTAVYYFEMFDRNDFSLEKKFYKTSKIGIKLSEKKLKVDKNDNETKFFLAATLGLRGAYERKRNRLVTSLKNGSRSLKLFGEIKKSGVGGSDINYGQAVFDYWMSAMSDVLFWLPGGKDNRKSAISQLESIRRNGTLVNKIVLYDLMEIYLNEKKIDKTRATTGIVLRKYKNNITAYFTNFDTYILQKKYTEARSILDKIKSISKNDPRIAKMVSKKEKKIKGK